MPINVDWAIGKFLLVLGVLVVAGVILLQWARRRGLSLGRKSPITVVARSPLDARHLTWLVEVRGRTLLLGGGNGQLNCLADLTPPAGETP